MTVLIVDDEASARSRLCRLLKPHPDLVIAGEAADGLEAVAQTEKLRPDLLFLDIEMPGLGGFEVLASIPPSVPLPLVIFVTGFDQHALAAFQANALAYLLKPVDPEHLATVLDRARRLHAFSGERDRERAHVLDVVRAAPKVLRQIVARKHDRMVLLPPEEVLWFEVDNGIVRARTATDSFWVNYQIGELEAGLPGDRFFRARREVLVNLGGIREIRPYFKSGFLLVMADKANSEIVVSERRVPVLRELVPGL